MKKKLILIVCVMATLSVGCSGKVEKPTTEKSSIESVASKGREEAKKLYENLEKEIVNIKGSNDASYWEGYSEKFKLEATKLKDKVDVSLKEVVENIEYLYTKYDESIKTNTEKVTDEVKNIINGLREKINTLLK